MFVDPGEDEDVILSNDGFCLFMEFADRNHQI